MHPLLQDLYGTQEKLASAQVAQGGEQLSAEDAAFAEVVFEEMEKQAAAEGIDLNALTEEELAAVYNEYATLIAEDVGAEQEKLAAFAGAAEQLGVSPESLHEADTLGRVMYHAYIDEATSAGAGAEFEKQAAAELEAFDELALHRAEATLAAINGDPSEFVKTASLDIGDEDLNQLIDERAGEMLEEAGYDLDELASLLDSDA